MAGGFTASGLFFFENFSEKSVDIGRRTPPDYVVAMMVELLENSE